MTVCPFIILGCQNVTGNGPRLSIFLVQKPSALLDNVELAETPLLTDADIVSYNWEDHYIVFTDEGFKKLPTSTDVGVSGKPFVVVADGKRCYLGAFWTGFSIWTGMIIPSLIGLSIIIFVFYYIFTEEEITYP